MRRMSSTGPHNAGGAGLRGLSGGLRGRVSYGRFPFLQSLTSRFFHPFLRETPAFSHPGSSGGKSIRCRVQGRWQFRYLGSFRVRSHARENTPVGDGERFGDWTFMYEAVLRIGDGLPGALTRGRMLFMNFGDGPAGNTATVPTSLTGIAEGIDALDAKR